MLYLDLLKPGNNEFYNDFMRVQHKRDSNNSSYFCSSQYNKMNKFMQRQNYYFVLMVKRKGI